MDKKKTIYSFIILYILSYNEVLSHAIDKNELKDCLLKCLFEQLPPRTFDTRVLSSMTDCQTEPSRGIIYSFMTVSRYSHRKEPP